MQVGLQAIAPVEPDEPVELVELELVLVLELVDVVPELLVLALLPVLEPLEVVDPLDPLEPLEVPDVLDELLVVELVLALEVVFAPVLDVVPLELPWSLLLPKQPSSPESAISAMSCFPMCISLP